MKSSTPQFVLATFIEEKRAASLMRDTMQMQADRLIAVQNAAILRRDGDANVYFEDAASQGKSQVAVTGGIFAAIYEALTALDEMAVNNESPAYLSLPDFANRLVYTLGKALRPGTSMLLLIIEPQAQAAVEKLLAQAEAEEVIIEAMEG
jgi:uncharacterized membrane protein